MGRVIDPAGLDRAFFAQSMSPLTLRDLTITGGRAPLDDPATANVEPNYGGAIVAFGGLTMERVVLEGNATRDAVGGGGGAGAAGGFGGAVFAISLVNPVTIVDSVLRDNAAGDGALAPAAGAGGASGGFGGAISADAPSLTIRRTTFTGNRSGDGGQGVGPGQEAGLGGNAAAAALSGGVTLENVIVAGNATGAAGQGPNATGGSAALLVGGASAALRFVTLVGNVAPDDAAPEGLRAELPVAAVVAASILSGTGAVCAGPLGDGGGNVTGLGSGCPGAVGDPGLDPDFIPAADGPAVQRRGRGLRWGRPAGGGAAAGRGVRRRCDRAAAVDADARPGVAGLPGHGPRSGRRAAGGRAALRRRRLCAAGGAVNGGRLHGRRVRGAHAAGAGSCAITATFRPSAPGLRLGTVSLATPLGARTLALSGSGRAPGAAGSSRARARVRGVALLRRAGRLRLRVRLVCPPGPRCTERLAVRVSRRRGAGVLLARRVALAGGARRAVTLTLPRAFAGLAPRARLRLRLRLVAPGSPPVERRVSRRVP